MTYYILLTPRNQVVDVVETSNGNLPPDAVEISQEQFELLNSEPTVQYEYVSGEVQKSIYADVAQKVNAAISDASETCKHQIINNFTSSVLGSEHQYKNTLEDQVNLMDLNSNGIGADIKCVDIEAKTDFAFKRHTAEQVSQLYVEMTQHKFTCLKNFSDIKERLISIQDEYHSSVEDAEILIDETLATQRR